MIEEKYCVYLYIEINIIKLRLVERRLRYIINYKRLRYKIDYRKL